MRIAIDTNRYVDFAKGLPDAVDRVRRADEILVPFVVVGELRAGFAAGVRSLQNEAALVRFLDSRRVDLVFADEETTHHYARLFYQLRRQGTPIPTNDLWIAALVVQHQVHLYARDTHFDHLPQIPRV
ncbi:MAG: type II toxin-antitoxin system VapC family toxin [Candidatus Rokubacteria bacterium]|nr:type II toxin-antitoxin system VapC family toxin [Candidatus Rokubacteria bacterium]